VRASHKCAQLSCLATLINSAIANCLPLPNAQFTPFVEDGGYDSRQWWTEAAWDWRKGREPALDLSCCAWLQQQLALHGRSFAVDAGPVDTLLASGIDSSHSALKVFWSNREAPTLGNEGTQYD